MNAYKECFYFHVPQLVHFQPILAVKEGHEHMMSGWQVCKMFCSLQI